MEGAFIVLSVRSLTYAGSCWCPFNRPGFDGVPTMWIGRPEHIFGTGS